MKVTIKKSKNHKETAAGAGAGITRPLGSGGQLEVTDGPAAAAPDGGRRSTAPAARRPRRRLADRPVHGGRRQLIGRRRAIRGRRHGGRWPRAVWGGGGEWDAHRLGRKGVLQLSHGPSRSEMKPAANCNPSEVDATMQWRIQNVEKGEAKFAKWGPLLS